jgi:REP element-mobilizing transposase RayT
MLNYRSYYRRHLPHVQPPGATLFVTFRLANSLPRAVLEALMAERRRMEQVLAQMAGTNEKVRKAYQEERRLFGRWDAALDTSRQGPRWLADPQIAALVVESLHYRDGRVYELRTFCVMPNHVHLVCTPLEKQDGEYHSLAAILHSLKRYTAREANKILGCRGTFWQQEYYDHVVRDEGELQRIVGYVLNNPVKAGMVSNWEEWPWCYLRS